MKLSDILVCVVNYEFSENADYLKALFSRVANTLLIDSSSPIRPRYADLIIENKYYPGLWNSAVAQAISFDVKWLLFVASDVVVRNPTALLRNIERMVGRVDVGVYSPSLDGNSRCAYFECKFAATGKVRDVPFIEGFFFLARTSLLADMHPIPPANEYGWGVDARLCHLARLRGLRVMVDDRCTIYHPAKKKHHAIDEVLAASQANSYLGCELRDWMRKNYQFVK